MRHEQDNEVNELLPICKCGRVYPHPMTSPEEVLKERIGNLDMAIRANEYFAEKADNFQSEVLLEMKYQQLIRERSLVLTLQSILAMKEKGCSPDDIEGAFIAQGYNQHAAEVRALIEKGVVG